jgi:hypothetical protein
MLKQLLFLMGEHLYKKNLNPIELKSGSVIGMLSLINNECMKDPIIAGSSRAMSYFK